MQLFKLNRIKTCNLSPGPPHLYKPLQTPHDLVEVEFYNNYKLRTYMHGTLKIKCGSLCGIPV